MTKQYVFNFKLDDEDRARLQLLAERLQRSQADSIRWLIRQATRGLQRPAGRERPITIPTDPIAIIGDWEEWGSSFADEREELF